MNGTLTVEGSLTDLADAAGVLAAHFAQLKVRVSALTVGGYSVEGAKAVLHKLASPQRTVIELLVANGGHVSVHDVRVALGRQSADTLRGLTGPISKHVNRLIAQGVLPAGTLPPTVTKYDNTAGTQRAQRFWMESELVPVFEAALSAIAPHP